MQSVRVHGTSSNRRLPDDNASATFGDEKTLPSGVARLAGVSGKAGLQPNRDGLSVAR